ncbi:uncharacterized protein LOC101238518 isoform X2 [Hydra vulgaris]|uniref:uncharacterized protein LOC101238518 isoform X2 n=1 Tax=Hydra vulgaris TaxID=6087 RepID=UPI001F5EE515|nr:uncharacterized protein LOC101238518 isoform X2 [Hydra vulgaris]
MSTLELVIKDLEFENEKIIIQTQEEIAILEDMQNNLRNKSAENEKLEEEIDKYNSDIKVLHSQFKQNQEITESLKTASTLLNRYLGDLRNNLKLKCQETDNERDKLEKISENYRSKWLRYEEEYEKCALAKEIRDFKLKVAKLDAEEKELNEMHQKMEIKIQQYENKKGFSKRQKEEAITAIIHLAQLNRIIMSLNIQIPTMIDEKTALCSKIKDLENKKEVYKPKIKDIKNEAFLKDKIPDEKPILQQLNVVNDGIRNSQFPHDQSTFLPKLPQQEQIVRANILQSSSSYIARIGNSKIRLPNFIVAQQSQMTNQDSNQTSSNYPKMPQLPKFPSFHKYSMNKLSSYKPEKSQLVKDIPPPVEPEKEEASYLPSLQLQNCYIQDKERPIVKESITRLPIGNFIAPLDQTTDEFFGLERRNNVECDEITQSPSPLSKFSFSPNQHAENLKKLKQSPGDAFFRTGRPMFNHNNPHQKCTDVNEESIKKLKSNPASSFNYNELLSESDSVVNVVSNESFPSSKSENFSLNRFSLDSPGIHFNTSSDHGAFTFSSATNFTQNNQTFPEPTFSFGVLENTKDAKSPAFSFAVNQQSYDQNPVQFGSFPSAELGCNVFNFGNESTESASDSPFNFSVALNDEKAPPKERFDFKFGGVSSQVKSSSFSFNI